MLDNSNTTVRHSLKGFNECMKIIIVLIVVYRYRGLLWWSTGQMESCASNWMEMALSHKS